MSKTVALEIRDSYRTHPGSGGVIASPGKFEGEMIYVPYFWQMYLEGGADDEVNGVLKFRVTDEDRALFPEIPKRQKWVRLWEDSVGFVRED